MWLLILSMLLSTGFAANPDPSATIVVQSYRDIQVYVSQIRIIDQTVETNVEAVIDPNVAFTYTGSFWQNAKVPSGPNSWQPVKLGERDLKVYNSETIKYVWPDCDYEVKPLECSFRNDHYYLETTVHVDDNQLVVKAVLYDSDAQIVNVSTQTNEKIIRWIKQQAITTQTTQAPQLQPIQPQIQANCGPTGCQPNQVLLPQNNANQLLQQNSTTTIINKPKEELPLKWEIPHNLTDNMLRQAMLGIWTGVRLAK